MYLKRLEIQGFKSFPDKIVLDFNQGITAVVGPNGSGKSNISDAIRWALGEQSVKSLRGSKMEDVIFAGTSNRKSLSFAEVTMVLDNSERKINLDFSEISVRRRMFRSGQSDYCINDTDCRMKDVHELFMDTGIGREGYSIISQGRIDEILSAKSEDRRQLFEEAAGIVKYKHRRNESLSKLEREKQNLIRVTDIINELELHLEPLASQAEKARLYVSLAEKLKSCEVSVFVLDVEKSEDSFKSISEGIENVKRDTAIAEFDYQNEKIKQDSLKVQLSAVEEKIDEMSAEGSENRSRKESKENDIRLFEQKTEHNEKNRERIFGDIDSKTEHILRLDESYARLEAKKDTSKKNLEANITALSEKQAELDEAAAFLLSNESDVDKISSAHLNLVQKKTRIEGDISRCEELYEQTEQRMEELRDNELENDKKLAEITSRVKLEQEKADEIDTRRFSIVSKNELYKEEKARLESLCSGLSGEINELSREYGTISQRHKLLTEMDSNYEGYYRSVKSVLSAAKKQTGGLSGICGAAAELISVDEKYEKAIEIALGSSLQNIVVRTEQDAQTAIAYLKKTNEGRATFLPLSSVKANSFSESDRANIMQNRNVLGIANELVKFDQGYDVVFSSLLGRTVIMDTLDNAVAFSKANKYKYRIVTLDGDVISPSGSVAGGSYSKSQSSILSHAREIKELAAKKLPLREALSEKQTEYDEQNRKLFSVLDTLEKNGFILHELDIESRDAANSLAQVKNARTALEKVKAEFAGSEEKIMNKITETNTRMRELKQNHAAVLTEIQELLSSLDDTQSVIQTAREKRDTLSAEITALKVEISSVEAAHGADEERAVRMANEKSKILDEIAKLKTEAENLLAQNTEFSLEIEKANAEIAELQINRGVNEEEMLLQRTIKSELSAQIEKSETDALELVKLTTRLHGEAERLEMSKEQSQTELRRLYDMMWEEYQITYQEALKFDRPDKSKTALDREIKMLKNEIHSLGVVNVAAIEEYKAALERHTFLTQQKADLIDAEEKLREIIRELKELMEKQFAEQFKIISQHFSVVFAEMFGGGSAYLRLLDEDDVLESGIEIVSQPPGKALQNIMLLSGGEKALTAIALLFAILKMKPSPFCILDEIESSLDDANVHRFANYLKNFSEETQFIIITHRKGTMEAADILYGVTMQEQGISKLVGVNFT